MSDVSQLRVIVHLVAALQFWFGAYYDYKYVVDPQEEPFGGKLKFLTIWNLYIQATFFTLCLLNDLLGNDKDSTFVKIKNYLQATIAFPLATFVAVVFWGLYAIDRELIFPVALEAYLPPWQNHLIHTNIVVFELLELSLSHCKYPTRCQGLATLSAFLLVYIAWVLIIFSKANHWVYPVLAVLNLPQRILFFGGLVVFGDIMYLLGEFLNSVFFNGKPIQKRPVDEKQKLVRKKKK